MDIIASGRQTGRTTELIKRSAEAESQRRVNYIITHSHSEAFRISKQAEELGLKIGFPLTFDEFLSRGYAGQNISHFYIDNAEMLIQRLTPIKIEAITILGGN
jgi:hypothetical protein